MPVLRPSGSDYTAVVKAAAQYVKPGTTAKQSKSGSGMMLAPPSLGAIARASYVGAKSSPASSVIQMFSTVATSTADAIFDIWAGKLAVVTTLAGSGGAAFADGTGSGASFSYPGGVAVLPNGNIFVADMGNHRIRLITLAGVVTTFAGDGTADFLDAMGTGARFNGPTDIALLPNGNFAIADTYNHRIRLITMPSGAVTTIAGDGTGAFLDGTGTGARFQYPFGIAADPNGNIVVADTYNHRIRLITMPGGVVTTLAGDGTPAFLDGTATGARVKYPEGVAVLPNGNIIVADRDNNRIRLITMPGGVMTTLAGDGTRGLLDGTGTGARFNGLTKVAVLPNGNLIIAESYSHCIRLITMPSGVVTTLAGDGTSGYLDGTGTGARFSTPRGLAVFSNGTIVVAGRDSQLIRLITPT